MGTRISFKKSLIVLGLAAIFALSGVLTAGAGEPLTMEQVKAKLEKHRGSSLVITSWGGSYQDAQRKAYYKPFEKEFGIKIIEDSPAAERKGHGHGQSQKHYLGCGGWRSLQIR